MKIPASGLMRILAAVCLVGLLGLGTEARAATEAGQPKRLNLTTGKSKLLETDRPVKRVSVASPEIAEVLVLSPRQIYINAKAPGLTNMTLWDEGAIFAIYDLEVAPDVTRLKEKLHELFPEEKDITVVATNDRITLTGTVSSASSLEQVLAVAATYAPCQKSGQQEKPEAQKQEKAGEQKQEKQEASGGKDKCPGVVNLLSVAGVQQVMLEVRVSEIQRSLLKRMGVNFATVSSSGNLGLSLLNNLIFPQHLPYPFFRADRFDAGTINPTNEPGTVLSQQVNAVLRFFGEGTTWTVFIDALKENGILKVMAEPTLLTLSGQPAKFLAGGEFPIPVPTAFDRIAIEYKEFGVALSFTPTVLSNGKISMKVAPEVSELDFENAIAIAGFVIPGLTTRRVSTTVELGDGQSFAIAGLLKDDLREVATKFPLLGDIPILGTLFRSTAYKKNETELVVIVTPRLVKPLDMAKQPLPTDAFVEPSDAEFYLMGRLEGKSGKRAGKAPAAADLPKAGMEGDFGHILP